VTGETGPALVHASVVAAWTPAGWRGVLIEGPSGAGKSSLALQLLAAGWRLVGDDYVHVWASGGALYARGPDRIRGRIEARGLGLVEASPLPVAVLALAVTADPAPERLPEPRARALCGLAIPRLDLPLDAALAPVLVARALRRLPCGPVLP
jgi:serine kinase of HPr protein (carbohydrate metabolism regulator)